MGMTRRLVIQNGGVTNGIFQSTAEKLVFTLRLLSLGEASTCQPITKVYMIKLLQRR